ncbi:hypothetical protein HYU07_00430 [Candidatus Woesearchaeota archaeon]|nr:hypothetical protein [Candidatus Woesearchaeota archaeon]
MLIAGCSDQKAQGEKLLKEHGETINAVATASDNANETAIKLSNDYLEAIKDNNIDSSEMAVLRKECEDRQLLSDKLKEEILKLKNYIENKQAMLMQAGIDIEDDKKRLMQAEDSLKNVESHASICGQLFGKSVEAGEGGGENEELDIKVDKETKACKKIGGDDWTNWQYEVTVTGEAWGPVGTYLEMISTSVSAGDLLQSSLACDSWSKTDLTYRLSSCYREEGQPFKTKVVFTYYYSSSDLARPEAWLSGLSFPGDTEWLERLGGYYAPINISIKHPEFEEGGYDLVVFCEEDDKQPKQPLNPLPCSAYWNSEWKGFFDLKDGRSGTVSFKLGQPSSACGNIPVTTVDASIGGKKLQELGVGINQFTCSFDCTDTFSVYINAYGDETTGSLFLQDSKIAYEFDKNGNAIRPVAIVGASDYVYEEGEGPIALPVNHKGSFLVKR